MMATTKAIERGEYTLDLAGREPLAVPVGQPLARDLEERGLTAAQVLVRVNGELVDDPTVVFPRPGDNILVDPRVRGA